jgi:neutral trehalase
VGDLRLGAVHRGASGGVRLAAPGGDKEAAALFGLATDRGRAALNTRLWDATRGYYINYQRPGFCESHFSIDALLAPYYGLTDPGRMPDLLSAQA